MKRFFILFLVGMLSACAAKNPLETFRFQTVTAPPYVNASWYRITDPGKVLKVYIEENGNVSGHAEADSENPTPKSLFLRQIAADDPSANVAYLARPCQYFQTGVCTARDWTTGRFSKRIVDSMDKTVAALMKKAKTNRVILIGYGDGAQIAGLIAVRHPDQVMHVYTIAGVLDHAAWTAYHQKPDLSDSQNLKQEQTAFLSLPQQHFVGGQDVIVPPFLVHDFVGDDRVMVIEKATHDTGYQPAYPFLYREE